VLPGAGNVDDRALSPTGQRQYVEEEVTLAEALKGAGYKTGLFGKWHLGAHKDHGPTKQGFDEFIGLRGGFIDNYNHHFLHGRGFYDFYEGTEQVRAPGKYFPDLITARALKFIDKHKDEPFFAYVAFNIPHYPEQADPKFDERYQKLPEPRRSYAKMISTTDDHVGRVLDQLEKHGLREKTIVVFMSDNGHSTEQIRIRVALDGADTHSRG
jgi:arylsulfatase A-like enzyme